MGKYSPLAAYLRERAAKGEKRVRMSFAEVEGVLEDSLPASALDLKVWWSNDQRGRTNARTGWLDAGWRKVHVDLKDRVVEFALDGAPGGERSWPSRPSEAPTSAPGRRTETSEAAKQGKPVPWSREEVRATVETYFEMWRLDRAGQSFSKRQMREALLPRLSQRTAAAVEYKFQNISAVLDESGVPYVQGYLPARNYQQLLAEVVQEYLDQASPMPARSPVASAPSSQDLVLTSPPERTQAADKAPPTRVGLHRVDWAAKEQLNRDIGRQGEQMVLELERRQLIHDGRADLADKVQWVAEEDDGAGFDILSFTQKGQKKLIEVKSTTAGQRTAFFLSANELEAAERHEHYELHRVYDLRAQPKVYILSRQELLALPRTCESYRVLPGRA